MYKIKKGDIVGRISYGKDILFTVQNIVKRKDGKKVAILKGLILRIEADADIEDLELIEKKQVRNHMRNLENKYEDKIKRCSRKNVKNEEIEDRIFLGRSEEKKNGKILHLDGDAHLSNQKKCSNINTYKQVIFNHD